MDALRVIRRASRGKRDLACGLPCGYAIDRLHFGIIHFLVGRATLFLIEVSERADVEQSR